MKRQNKSNKNWSHKHDYPEEEIWQTGHLIAQLIATRLRAFRSYDKMIYAFELYAHGTIAPEEQEAF